MRLWLYSFAGVEAFQVDVAKVDSFRTEPLWSCLADLSSLLVDITSLDFFFFGDLTVSLVCISVTVAVVVVSVAKNISPSWLTWPVRRELILRAEGGETTVGGGLEAVPTFDGFVSVLRSSMSLCLSARFFSFCWVAAAIASPSFCLFLVSLERVGIPLSGCPGRRTVCVESGVVKIHDQGANPRISFDNLTLSKGSLD